ncbi:ADOP family duplicated permease [Paludibaculum fermentans]|uniref:ABC transporter permease n=1 Tax=Paludibaculum fermentans TaxID=1473598 RepID=A0A7S7NUG7_PALFE|nr:ADOP family duplicated permease [Paludibaculum fermentans]QOY89953.1 ABC transporter permease [Paludibaculum fermentans]
MSFWTRITNVFRGERLNRDIDEELEAHVAEAVVEGRNEAEARRALGAALRLREESRDLRLLPWLDSLRADAVLGWRQLMKRKVTSASAILSLALAIGACTAAFRLVDALLLRPLPVAEPERLFAVSYEKPGRDGRPGVYDSCSYPMFQRWQSALNGQAELLAISYPQRVDLAYGSDQEMEKAHRQYVSGRLFPAFGLRPALGRLLSEDDDRKQGASPYVVLSYDYWQRRFGGDPGVIGRSLRLDAGFFTIAGVAEKRFTGVEPGTVTDVFVPITMKNPASLGSANSFWFHTMVRLKQGGAAEPVRDLLAASYRAFEEERLKGSFQVAKAGPVVEATLNLEPAAAGASRMQREYRRPLTALSVLVALVLLIACANVANLMTAQGWARGREMALRVAIGAGRGRLVQLVLVEGAWIAGLAAAAGGVFAAWSAPFVVSMINPPDDPARLVLPADWRVFGFSLLLTLTVTILFGAIPALRAAAVHPAGALKGGADPHSRRRVMNALIAAQVTFCFLVLFVAGLFAATFDRLNRQPVGFSPDGLLALETVASSPQLPAFWNQVADRLRSVPGVESVGISAWPMLTGEMRNHRISIGGHAPGDALGFTLAVSPGWLETMRITMLGGRDFRREEMDPSVAIVNETFARQFFQGENALGKSFEMIEGKGVRIRVQIVGLVRDAAYRNLRESMLPVAYLPFQTTDQEGAPAPLTRGTFLVRSSRRALMELAPVLRQAVSSERSEFRVSNLRTQAEIVRSQTVRERLLAMLALFFAVVALVLAGVGLYGVMDYTALQRRREISIRMALGARGGDIAVRVTSQIYSMVAVGATAGLALGVASVGSLESLFYQVKATDLPVLAFPSIALLAAALLASMPAVVRAVRTDPARTLRAD